MEEEEQLGGPPPIPDLAASHVSHTTGTGANNNQYSRNTSARSSMSTFIGDDDLDF